MLQEIEVQKEHDKSENDIKSLQSVGQIVGEVLKQLTEEKFIVKATNGPRYVVGCRRSVNKGALKQVFFYLVLLVISKSDELLLFFVFRTISLPELKFLIPRFQILYFHTIIHQAFLSLC